MLGKDLHGADIEESSLDIKPYEHVEHVLGNVKLIHRCFPLQGLQLFLILLALGFDLLLFCLAKLGKLIKIAGDIVKLLYRLLFLLLEIVHEIVLDLHELLRLVHFFTVKYAPSLLLHDSLADLSKGFLKDLLNLICNLLGIFNLTVF